MPRSVLPSASYIFNVEYGSNPKEHPINVYVRKVNIDPKDGAHWRSYKYAEAHGTTFASVMKEALDAVLLKEQVRVQKEQDDDISRQISEIVYRLLE